MESHNFLFVSLDGLIGDIAWAVQQEGHSAKYAIIADEFSQDVADGIVPKATDWEAELPWADVVVFDDGFGLGTAAERVRDRGIPAVGGTPLTDRLEEDRGFGHDTMADLGLDVIDSVIFDSIDDGIDYVRANPNEYVIKPCGETQNYNHLLYVGQAHDGADVILMLERYRDHLSDEIEEFQLQRAVDGVELSVCGFFDGEQFVEPINYTFEHKRLFPGDLGPMTGEMGTSMFWDPPNALFHETVGRFEPLLRREGYVGAFDINCIINESGIRPLEITPRFGYPQISVQEEGLVTPMGELLLGLATHDPPSLQAQHGYQVGFRMCVPPFPAEDDQWFDEQSRELTVKFRGDGIPEGIHLEDIKLTDGEYRVAGATGEVLVVAGTGATMGQAQEEAYDRASQVILPGKFYRNDIGNRWHQDAERLAELGYLEHHLGPRESRPA